MESDLMEQKVLEITSLGGAVVVAFLATSMSSSEGIAAGTSQIMGFVEANKPLRVVFDFEKVKFFSSQVLGLLLQVRKKVSEYGGEVVVSAIDPQLYRVFKITNLDKIFKFFADKDSAVISN